MAKPELNVDPGMFLEYIDESLDMLFEVEKLLVELEQNPSNLEIINTVFRPIHTIKGNSSFFELLKVKKLSHELETLLDLIRKNKIDLSKELVSILLRGTDKLKTMFTLSARAISSLLTRRATIKSSKRFRKSQRPATLSRASFGTLHLPLSAN